MGNTSPQSKIVATETVDAEVIKGTGGQPSTNSSGVASSDPGTKRNQSQDDPAVQAGSLPASGSPSSSGASAAASLGSTLWSVAISTAEDIPGDAEIAFMALKGIIAEAAKMMQNAGHYASVDFSAFKTLLGKAYGLAEKIHSKV